MPTGASLTEWQCFFTMYKVFQGPIKALLLITNEKALRGIDRKTMRLASVDWLAALKWE